MGNCIRKLSDKEVVDLSALSVDELYELHYSEECFIANEAKQLPPFSDERNRLLHDGYEFVEKIMSARYIKENGTEKKSFGVSKHSVKVLTELFTQKVKHSKTEQIVLYEVGIGSGYALQKILEVCEQRFVVQPNASPQICIKGCDIYIDSNIDALMKKYPNLDIKQGHVLDCIKNLPDNSIDLFYADNVVEHFLPDETEFIFEEISKKLKHNAHIFLIVPNKFTGPHDISRKFLPMGAKARGFHFMEMSFGEVTKLMNKNDIYHLYCTMSIPKITTIIIKNKLLSKTLLRLKLSFEPLIAKIPFKLVKKVIFYLGGYSSNIMKKVSK